MPQSSQDAHDIWLLYEQLAPIAPAPAPQQPASQPAAAQQPVQPFALRTFGDLKAIINRIKFKQKAGNLATTAATTAIDSIIGLVPGLASAKTVFDFFKAATARPDTQKTKSFIDQLDVDDSMSKIVDDTVENEFLQSIERIINAYPDAQPMPANWNMTNELIKFLRNKYKQSPVVLQHLYDVANNVRAAAPMAPR